MSLLTLFFGDKYKEPEPKATVAAAPRDVDPSIDTLELGWYLPQDKEEIQLARIAEKDRATHFYVIGATGSGKTKFLESLIRQDIEKGNGLAVIDPHGDLVEDIKGYIDYYHGGNEDITGRVILVDPTDPEYTVTFNPLEKLPDVSISEQVNELISAFRKIWSDSWGVRMEDLLRNSLIALSEAELTLIELPRFLMRRDFRKIVLEKISNSIARDYFQRFDSMTDKSQATWIDPVMNKINAFFSDERIRQMFASSTKSSFNIREAMDTGKILLVKLDKGRLKDAADLLGSLIMAKIQMAAFSRANIPANQRTPFYLYIDEFQNFATGSFMVILSEARKYGLSLIMAHQTLVQISGELKSLILGNAGIQVYFRVSHQDASILSKEAFEYSTLDVNEKWEHKIEDLQTLPPRWFFVKHKVEGGIIALHALEVDSPWEGERVGSGLGMKYMVARAELARLAEERQGEFDDVLNGRKAENAKKTEKAEKDISKPEAAQTEEPKAEKQAPESPPVQPVKPERVAPVTEGLSDDERVFLEFISLHPGMFVTKIYKELGLSGYKGDRLKEGLIEKGLLVQQETREGVGGRLAKILALKGKSSLAVKESALAGKGGDAHKYLQKTLKEQAELYGWKAVIEERIPRSLESVDVGLRRDDVRIAIEISATSKVDYEIQNIRKCLEAGYDYVILVSSDDKQLSALKTGAKKSFTVGERERIRFCLPSEVKGFLLRVTPTGIVSEKGVVSERIPKEKQLMDTNEASEFLGISKNTLYEWVVQNKVPYIKVGRLVKFRKVELEEWLKKRTRDERKSYV
ncbi:MAG: helix-turn-helix domain-containing protein [Nitrospirota bacterium]